MVHVFFCHALYKNKIVSQNNILVVSRRDRVPISGEEGQISGQRRLSSQNRDFRAMAVEFSGEIKGGREILSCTPKV